MSLKSLLVWVVLALGLLVAVMLWTADAEPEVGAGTDLAVEKTVEPDVRDEVIPLRRPAEAPGSDDSTPAPVSVPRADGRKLLDEAAQLVRGGKVDQARRMLKPMVEGGSGAMGARASYLMSLVSDNALDRRRLLSNALLARAVTGAEFEDVRETLDTLNIRTASSLLPLIETAKYEVKPGDSLWVLCNKTFPRDMGVTHEVGLIQLVNGLSSPNLRVGDTLLVPLEPLRLVVSASDHGLICLLGDVVVSAFHVGLGRESRTPVGDFTVQVKQENPDWYHNGKILPFGDPENVLGTRWMGFQNQPGASGFGIHGTAHPDSIGLNESMGCIRMRNEEVEVLFGYVSRGTVVSIVE